LIFPFLGVQGAKSGMEEPNPSATMLSTMSG